MKSRQTKYSIKDILQLYGNEMLRVNHEYQRGSVWTPSQQKRLIDSVLRGYALPSIYLHRRSTSIAGLRSDAFDIIDGQQRIRALHEFFEGAYRLFDPVADEAQARFPRFVQEQPCSWARAGFDSLNDVDRSRLLETELSVVEITADNDHEIRDLFVRLQSGFPLNAQEKRDAYPGAFTEFILKLGGKEGIARYPGHPFFQRVLRMKPTTARGKIRQTAAQIAMLFIQRRQEESDRFTDTNSVAVDDFYYKNIDFDSDSPEVRRLTVILDKLDELLGDGKRPKMQVHTAIHLVLLVDSIWDNFTRSWEDKLASAVDSFTASLAAATRLKDSPNPGEYWVLYGQWARVNSDRGDRIRLRHEFYVQRMLQLLEPLERKDIKRAFDSVERQMVYFRDAKLCAVCRSQVVWDEAEIHHVLEHSKGGATRLDNATLVHAHCHPQGQRAVEFAREWDPKKSTGVRG